MRKYQPLSYAAASLYWFKAIVAHNETILSIKQRYW
jgi:hypothetical protein